NADRDGDKERRTARITELLAEIDGLLTRGVAEYEAWQEVNAAIKDRAAVTAQEHRRLVDMRVMMTPEDALAVLLMVTDIIRSRVGGDVAKQISAEIDRRMGFTHRLPRLGSEGA